MTLIPQKFYSEKWQQRTNKVEKRKLCLENCSQFINFTESVQSTSTCSMIANRYWNYLTECSNYCSSWNYWNPCSQRQYEHIPVWYPYVRLLDPAGPFPCTPSWSQNDPWQLFLKVNISKKLLHSLHCLVYWLFKTLTIQCDDLD